MPALEIIPIKAQIQDSLELAGKYHAAFEYNDFFSPDILDQPALIDERISFYLKLNRDRSQDTLHGVFLDITVHSSDSLIRKISSKRIHQSMEIASALGVKAVIFHTNFIANFHDRVYMDNWLTSNKSYFQSLSCEYPQLQIYMENMFDLTPELFTAFGQTVRDIPNLHLCLDVAHAALSNVSVKDWITSCAPYVRHLHINDNDGVSDLHHAVGQGIINWYEFDQTLRFSQIEPSVLVETNSIEKQRLSLEFMEKQHIYPFP